MNKMVMYSLLILIGVTPVYAEDLSNLGSLGERVLNNPQPAKTIPVELQVLENRIANGDIEALFEISVFYFKGVGVERDVTKAIHYLTLAAEKNHVKALYNLSSLYLDGVLVEQDIKKGLDYLEKAVSQKYIPAQVAYAFLYLDGTIVGQDIEKAYTYLAIASNNPNITKEELEEIIRYKKNVAKKLTTQQVEAIEDRLTKQTIQ